MTSLEMDSNDQKKMRIILFYVFLSFFVILTSLTILSLFFNVTKLNERYQTTLVTTFVIEVGVAIVALFYGLFGMSKKESHSIVQTKISGSLKIYISSKENNIYRTTTYSGYYETFNEETGEKKLIENLPVQWEAGNFLWFSIREIADNTFIKIGITDSFGKKWESDHINPRTVKFEKLLEI